MLLEDQYDFCFDLILILQEQEILILQIENEFRILIPCIFLAILQSAPFFQQAGREDLDKKFFFDDGAKF